MSDLHRMPNLELRDLRLVHAIARHGGLGAASRHLHVTESALSHHLRALEDRLGVSVFDRVGRGLLINARGSRLVDLAEKLLPQVLEAERALATPAPPPREIRITTGCYTAYPWLAGALHRLTESVPGTRVAIVVDATRRATEALLQGEVDLAVMPWLVDDKRLLARPVFEEEISAVMLPGDSLARAPTVPVAVLAKRRVLTHEMRPTEVAWARAALGSSSSFLRHAERVPLTEVMVALSKAGEAVSLMGTWAIKADIESGALVARPLRPRLRRPFAVVTARSRPADPRADILASVLRSWAREPAPALGAPEREPGVPRRSGRTRAR